MSLEKRPTCVTVIGWAWIIIGSLMCFSAIIALFSFLMIQTQHEACQNMPAIFGGFFPLIVVVQIGIAVLGIVSGINFLNLKSWSRNVLELLSWLLLFFTLGFIVFWVSNWISITSSHDFHSFNIIGAVMGIVIFGIYSVPLGIMVKYLRCDKVKNAVVHGSQSSHVEKRWHIVYVICFVLGTVGVLVMLLLVTRGGLENNNDKIFEAVRVGDVNMTKVLLEKNPDLAYVIDSKFDRLTPLELAVREGHMVVVKLLLDHMAEHSKGHNFRNALYWASREGRIETVKLLLRYGANIEYRIDNIGPTALHTAVRYGHEELIKLLLKEGIDIDIYLGDYGVTPLHEAITTNETTYAQQLKIARELLEAGADVNAKMGFGETALHKAAIMGRRDLVRLLLDYGADTTLRTKDGSMAIHWAVSGENMSSLGGTKWNIGCWAF